MNDKFMLHGLLHTKLTCIKQVSTNTIFENGEEKIKQSKKSEINSSQMERKNKTKRSRKWLTLLYF